MAEPVSMAGFCWEERLWDILTYLCSRGQLGLPTVCKVPKLFRRSQGLGVAPIQLVDNDVVENE